VRILVLNQYFHPDRSATSQLLTELCEDLARHHEVWVVTGRPSYNPSEATPSRGLVSRERHGDVRVARVWSTSFPRADMAGRLTNYGTYLLSSIAGAFSVADPDVVVALTDPPPVGLIGVVTAAARRRPFVLVTKDIFPDVAIRVGKLSNPAVIRTLRAMSRLLFRRADRVVSIGRDMDRRLVELGVPLEKIETIHDWSNGSLVRPLDGPSTVRKEHGWEDRFVVMHSGNVGLSQSLETLVDAAALLRDQEDIVIAIVGDGAAKAGLQRRARERKLSNVAFLPYQPKASLSQSLGAADIHYVGLKRGLVGFIVPSKVYGIMAAGKPYVAAVEPGSEPALVVEEHGCGFVVEPDDPEALARAIVEAREAPLEELGRRGREAFKRLYDRPIATGAYRRLLEEVVEESSSRH
jgi:colanic acid biosynthesis glycosyl transferase WcaI